MEDKRQDKVGAMPLVAMLVIFSVSLFASFFPTLSNRVSYLRIPPILFFIGKHFGTGVILSTAFVHLLQDAFEALLDPQVKRLTGVGEWAGLLVLGSLVSIFLVEYISTSYVDRLHSNSPHGHSHSHSHPDPYLATYGHSHPNPHVPSDVFSHAAPDLAPGPNSSSSLIHHSTTSASYNGSATPTRTNERPRNVHEPSSYFTGHHRHELPGSHAHHRRAHPRATPGGLASFYGSQYRTSSTRGIAESQGVTAVNEEDTEQAVSQPINGHTDADNHEDDALSRKRQIVSILVLQVGIMLHSFVIGLTLSVTTGADFTSLLVAVCFHQLFEGLSLGIRIANLPLSHEHSDNKVHIRGHLLRPMLALLFAATVPVGITLGLFTLRTNSLLSGPQIKMTQGIMAALSAGLLIYAATVEMLAADFVLAAGPEGLAQAHPAKQALALVSLFAGVAGMSVIGIWS